MSERKRNAARVKKVRALASKASNKPCFNCKQPVTLGSASKRGVCAVLGHVSYGCTCRAPKMTWSWTSILSCVTCAPECSMPETSAARLPLMLLVFLARSRSLNHRIKSINMSTFTDDEVEALSNGGNKVTS